MSKIYIIAEAGVNHNGRLDMAIKLVDTAFEAGADAVKFQTFMTEKNISRGAPKAGYQLKDNAEESQFDMLKRLELTESDFTALAQHCKDRGIDFFSTPDDSESIDLLVRLGIKTIKIASGEMTNLPHLRRIGGLGRKVILSTGMSTLAEVAEALDILLKSGTQRQDITLLHCTTEYPAPLQEVNLNAMLTMKKAFNVRVGYSDHTLGIEIPVAAAALGAEVIEKHLTMDKELPGPDHKSSLSPVEFTVMIKAIRGIEKAMGDGSKVPTASELKNMKVVRRSLFAARPIRKGEVFTEHNLIAKRPATGISPMKWDSTIGQRAMRDFKQDEMIER